jgi:hypothetical protein
LRSNSDIQTDPQASNQKAARSILMSKASSKSISDSPHGLAKTTSTRRAQPLVDNVASYVESSVFEQAAPEVVPASFTVPVSKLRDSTSMSGAAEQFVNPLRAQ